MKHFKRNFLMTAVLAFVLSGFVFGGNFVAAASKHTYEFKYYTSGSRKVQSSKSNSTIEINCSGDSNGIFYFLYRVDGGDVENFSYPGSNSGCSGQLEDYKKGLKDAGFKVETLKIKYDNNGHVITNSARYSSSHTYEFSGYYMDGTRVVTSNKSDSTINITCSGDSGVIYFLYSVDGGDVQNFSYPSSSAKGCTEQLNKFKSGLANAGFIVSTTLKVKYDSNGHVITDADSYKPSVITDADPYKPSVPSTSDKDYSTSNPNGATILNDCWSKAQSDNDGSGIKCILNTVVDIMTVGVGILGVLGIIIVGIQYLTAADNEAQTTKAKRRLFEIVIGLVAYVLIYAILKWLLPNF